MKRQSIFYKEKYPIMHQRNEYSEINVFIGAVKHFTTHVLTQLWHEKDFSFCFFHRLDVHLEIITHARS